MPRFSRSDIAVAALVATALGFGALGFAGFTDNLSNSLLFVAWSLTLLTLFVLAIRLPLRGGGSRLSAWVTSTLIASAAIVVVIAANVALFRHDAHFDVTQGGRNTPPKQLTDVIEHLHTPLSLTYFLNTADANAVAMRDLITIAARSHPLLAFRAIDLDKEPGLARDNGVHSYNTAVLQAGDRKVLVENVTDPARLGYAVLRALRERPETICFITGHGETFRPTPDHFHYSHVETLRGHDTSRRRRRARCRAGATRSLPACAERDRLRHAWDHHGSSELHSVRLRGRCGDRSTNGIRARAKRTCWSSIWRLAAGSCC